MLGEIKEISLKFAVSICKYQTEWGQILGSKLPAIWGPGSQRVLLLLCVHKLHIFKESKLQEVIYSPDN